MPPFRLSLPNWREEGDASYACQSAMASARFLRHVSTFSLFPLRVILWNGLELVRVLIVLAGGGDPVRGGAAGGGCVGGGVPEARG
jgi:hypothetical protein